MTTTHLPTPARANLVLTRLGRAILTFLLLLLFLISLELITSACRLLGSDYTKGIILVTGNPIVSLFIGLLATVLIQSSSTLTSSLVALVASSVISLEAAVPLVLGANIGTSLTSMMVSFGHLGTPKAFRRGFMVASSHVAFNIISALIFFPLEYQWKILSKSSRFLANHIGDWGTIGQGWFLFYDTLISPVAGLLRSVVSEQPIAILGFSLVLLFMCIYGLTLLFRSMLVGGSGTNKILQVFNKPLLSLFSGAGFTAAIHSSGVTTSICVMLAATEKISPKKLFPFILGANVGTTVTALMAAIGRSEAALGIALCHLIFNLLGVLLFYPIVSVRNIPVHIGRWWGILAQKNLAFAFGSIFFLFFALPFLVIFVFQKFGSH